MLGFLASFENYNTTIFTIVSKSTLTTVLASKVRYGINPSISALAVIIIALTLIGAVYFEIIKRREEKYDCDVERRIKAGATDRASKASLLTNPAMIIATLIFLAGFGTVYFAGTIGVDECKAVIAEEKAVETRRKVDEFKNKQMFKKAAPSPDTGTDSSTVNQPEAQDEDGGSYNSIFAPTNLEEQVDSNKEDN